MAVYIHSGRNNYFFMNLFEQLQTVPESGQGYFFAYRANKGFFIEKKDQWLQLYTLFYRCTNTYSFEKTSDRLFEEFKKKITTGEELVYASKCAKKIECIAKYREKGKNKQQESTRALSIQFFTLHFELLNKAARVLKEANVSVACRFQMFETAIELIEQGADLQLAAGYYDPLLILACKTARYSLAIQLIVVGANISIVTPYLTKLLLFSLEQKLESVASKVILAGVDCNYINTSGHSLLELAISRKLPQIALQLLDYGAAIDQLDHTNTKTLFEFAIALGLDVVALKMITLGLNLQAPRYKTALHIATQFYSDIIVRKILEKNIDPNTADTNGDFPLHLSCRSGNLVITKLLIEHGAHSVCFNKARETPLKVAFTSPDWGLNIEKMKAVCCYFCRNSPVFNHQIQNDGQKSVPYFTCYPRSLISESQNNKNINPIEIAFLLQDSNLCRSLASKMTRMQFNIYLGQLRAQYPNSSMDLIILSPYTINPTSLINTVSQTKIPPKPDDIAIKDLFTLFEKINFHNPNEPDYYNPEEFSVDTGIQDPKKLRAHLHIFINRVENKIAYLGTPASGTQALADFYDYIERAVTHIIQSIQARGDTVEGKKENAKTVIEFLRAAAFCGGRYYATAVKEYNRVIRKISPTFEGEIVDSLGSYREIILQSLVRCWGEVGQNVHDFNQLMHALGKELGIPGADMMSSFDDKYGCRTNKIENREKFFNLYTAISIVNDWVEPQINSDSALRDKFIDWSKTHLPIHWGKEQFQPIRQKLLELRVKKVSTEEIKTFLKNEHGIIMDKMSPEEAIEDERRMCYLATAVVVDMNAAKMRMQKSAIVYMLEKIGVVSTVWGNSLDDSDENQVAFYWPFQLLQGLGNKLRQILNW